MRLDVSRPASMLGTDPLPSATRAEGRSASQSRASSRSNWASSSSTLFTEPQSALPHPLPPLSKLFPSSSRLFAAWKRPSKAEALSGSSSLLAPSKNMLTESSAPEEMEASAHSWMPWRENDIYGGSIMYISLLITNLCIIMWSIISYVPSVDSKWICLSGRLSAARPQGRISSTLHSPRHRSKALSEKAKGRLILLQKPGETCENR